VDPAAIPIVDDGKNHEVVVQLGDPAATAGDGTGRATSGTTAR
jgi:hypothetical protein